LKKSVERIDAYDVILIGSPNWWGTFASPIRTFLSQHNFSGKKVALFITHGSGGLGKSVTDLKSLYPDAIVLDGLAVQGGKAANAKAEVNQWLKRIGVSR
jgi:multimeric flavodoxin WrbA